MPQLNSVIGIAEDVFTAIYLGENSTDAELAYDKARLDTKFDYVALFQNMQMRLHAEPKIEAGRAVAEQQAAEARAVEAAAAAKAKAQAELDEAKRRLKEATDALKELS